VSEFRSGDMVIVRDARGHTLRKRALGPAMQGGSFRVVWACREEEWQAARAEGREPEGMPWPAEDVFLPEEAQSA
jgi:hypothetical protein